MGEATPLTRHLPQKENSASFLICIALQCFSPAHFLSAAPRFEVDSVLTFVPPCVCQCVSVSVAMDSVVCRVSVCVCLSDMLLGDLLVSQGRTGSLSHLTTTSDHESRSA